MKTLNENDLRFEHSYNGLVTVIEGSELTHLLNVFLKTVAENTDIVYEDVLVEHSALYAYETVYGMRPTEAELHDLSTADARKVDLLRMAMKHYIKTAFKKREGNGFAGLTCKFE